jgi:hypothetical protein
MWAHQWATIRNLVVLLSQWGDHLAAAELYGAVLGPGQSFPARGAERARLDAAMDTTTRSLGPHDSERALHCGHQLTAAAATARALAALSGRTGARSRGAARTAPDEPHRMPPLDQRSRTLSCPPGL